MANCSSCSISIHAGNVSSDVDIEALRGFVSPAIFDFLNGNVCMNTCSSDLAVDHRHQADCIPLTFIIRYCIIHELPKATSCRYKYIKSCRYYIIYVTPARTNQIAVFVTTMM